jgi:hypothetical protein
MGEGHVVCHNLLSGWGDAMKLGQDGARAVDFYDNDVTSAYDNGLEFDGAAGNVRALRNRFTNTYATISFQPVHGGPVYAVRNLVVNVAHEQLKFHNETSGIEVLHNTFVSADHALELADGTTSHHFELRGNLFVGPDGAAKVAEWSGGIDDGTFDGNGWWPDGRFDFDAAGDWPTFAAMQADGVFESTGILLDDGAPLASGVGAPARWQDRLDPTDPTLDPTSAAVDAGAVLPGVTDGFTGAAPDLGAQETGCPAPAYGPRPEGVDESTASDACPAEGAPTGTTDGTNPTGPGGTSADGGGGAEGGCGCGGGMPGGWVALGIVAALIGRTGLRAGRTAPSRR